MGAWSGNLLVAEEAALARVLAAGKRRVAIHAEDEARMNARKHLRIGGDASSHPVWRDDESAMLATRRILQLARAPRPRHRNRVVQRQRPSLRLHPAPPPPPPPHPPPPPPTTPPHPPPPPPTT